jgi:alkylation response protein AidB-like acyl-CoA dehydrogenase
MAAIFPWWDEEMLLGASNITRERDGRPLPDMLCGRQSNIVTVTLSSDIRRIRRGEGIVSQQTQVTEKQAREAAEAARETEWTKPSFGKELYLGNFRLDLIHPHPVPSEEDRRKGEAFLEKLEAVLREKVDPLEVEREGVISDDAVRALIEIGALGMKIPEEYGGLGLSQVYYNRALGVAGTWHSAISTLLSAHQSIGVPQPVKLFGTEEQKKEWLPRCAKEISAFLLTEPDVGSDPARMGATAEPTEDGEAYILNGVKLWTTNGVIADILVVMARVPKSEGHSGGISTFLVDMESEGITVEHRNEFMGLRGIENGVTRFDNVRIPKENLLGKEGMGLKIALTTLNTGRLSLPAVCSAMAKYSLKIAREWSNERVQWGQPIGKHEAIAQKISFIAATSFALDAITELASAAADDGRVDVRIEAAIAKLYGSEMGWQIVDEMVQMRGGRGYETAQSLKNRGEKPVPAEQLLRDMRINRIFEGSSEIMKLLIAREAVDQHLQVAGDFIEPDVDPKEKAKIAAKAAGFYAKWLPGLAFGKGQAPVAYADEFGELGEHLRFVERTARKLARSTFYGMSRWQAKLEKKQAFLGRIVDIGCELYAMSATVVRARMLADEGEVAGAEAKELADMFCKQARRRIDRLFHELWQNDDDENYAFAQRVLDGDFTWVEHGIIDPSGDGSMIDEPDEHEDKPNVWRRVSRRDVDDPDREPTTADREEIEATA